MEIEHNYKIISIDSSRSIYTQANTHNFYINLDEPLRNVYKINIITILADVPQTASFQSLDPINIRLNDYKRLISKKDGNNLYYFDSIIVENSISSRTTIKNDYNTTDNVYYLNPLEPQLSRFELTLYDKNNDILTTSNISRFIIKLGVYYSNKKTTRI